VTSSSAGRFPRGSRIGRAGPLARLAASLLLICLGLLEPQISWAKEQPMDGRSTPNRVTPNQEKKVRATPTRATQRRATSPRATTLAKTISPERPLRAGDVAKKPAPERSRARPQRGPRSWREYAKVGWRRGYVTLQSPGIDRRWTGYVLGPGDTLLPRAERQIRRVLASWRTGKSREIDRRLIRLIARVSDVFGGRTIRVVSGYRETSHAKRSHHKTGEALDFSIEGVPNWALRDYLQKLERTGVGYYPNSSFVHVDVRAHSASWVDLSRPGAPPRYAARARPNQRSRAD
jgi:hypothetical protein